MRIEMFRGYKIFLDHGYPAVYWPEHPLSRKHGVVRIHRIIAHESYNEIPTGYHVHHKDGDVWNWNADNLEVISKSEHGKIHNQNKVVGTICSFCWTKVRRTKSASKRYGNNDYCSQSCHNNNKQRVDWPDTEELQKLVKERGFVGAGRVVGVSDNAVRYRLKQAGLM